MNELLGKKLRVAREARGLKQEDAAKVLKKTFQAVSSFESGRTRVDVHTLVILCDLYHVDLYDMLDIKTDSVLNGQEKEMLRLFRGASGELQNAALAMLSSAQNRDMAQLFKEESGYMGMAARGKGVIEADGKKKKELELAANDNCLSRKEKKR